MGAPDSKETTESSSQTTEQNTPERKSQVPQFPSEQWNLQILESGPDLEGEKAEDRPPLSSRCAATPTSVGKDQDTTYYPEGGLRAWLVVFGSWCGILASMGTVNIMGVFQSYLMTHQLSSYSPGVVGWIFSVYSFLVFAGGIVIGPVFDKYGPEWLVLAGSVGVCLTMLLMGVCEKYWHFLVVFGLLGGGSTSLIYSPAIAAIGHYFNKRRGNATGIAATGGAIGGVIFPLILEALIPRLGFAWSTRILGFIYVCLCIIAFNLIRSRLPPGKNASAKPDFRIFKDRAFAITVLGLYLLEWALFVPLAYTSSYVLHQGFSSNFSYEVLVILNVGSIFGRWLPGFYADSIGRYNTMILTTVLTVVSVLGVWLPAGGTKAGIMVFALTFGFGSGTGISLAPVCIGQLCHTENYGRYFTTCYTIVSIGCLTGIPIVGELVAKNHGSYWGLIVFVGVCDVGGLAAFIVVRIMETGWKLKVVY